MGTTKQTVKTFRGLNNVSDPLRLSLDSFVQADNVDINQTYGVLRCRGFTQRTNNTAITGAFATKDQKRMYVVDGGEIRSMNKDLTYTVVKSGLSSNKLYFEEVNESVFYSNGTDYGILTPAGWRPWGIVPPATPVMTSTSATTDKGLYQVVCTLTNEYGVESGSSEVAVAEGSGSFSITNIEQRAGHTTNLYLTTRNGTVFMLAKRGAGSSESYSDGNLGVELPYWGTDVPRGSVLAQFKGQMYLAEAYPQYDYTAIWASLPLQYYHFDYGKEGLSVPGTVRMLKATKDALVIGTDRQILAWNGDELEVLAEYGVVNGWHATTLGNDTLFWSLRGLCSVFPFKNLTEKAVSVPPGVSAGATVLEKDGMRRYVVALRKDDEQAYNRR